MSRILFALLLLIGCKKDEEAQPAPAVRDAPKSMSAKDVLLALPTTKNGCADVYDYFPEGGMRIFWCHVETVLPYAKLSELAGVPVFLSGPHTKDRLVLDSPDSYGHYNPSFVRWMIDKALPSVTDPAAKKELEPIYDRFMRQRGRIYFSALLFQQTNPDVAGDEHAPEDWPNEFPPAVAFWNRRSSDGTRALFEEGLKKLLAAYDPSAIEEISRKDWKASPTKTVEEAPPIAPGTIGERVKLTWSSLKDRAPETACPDQFAYDPGGLRVQYCRAASLLSFGALQEQLDFPIFLKGPHTKTALNLESNDFGRYNPKFVEWMIEHAVPSDPAGKRMAQASYDRFLKVPARMFLFARETLKRDAKLRIKMRSEYDAFLKKPEPGAHPHWTWESLIPAPSYEEQAIGGTAFAFWLRRSMDGTDELFDRALRKAMSAFDADLLRQVDAAKTAEALRALFGPPETPEEEEFGD